MPFDAENYQADEQQSYAREWLAAASQQGEAHTDFIQPLAALEFTALHPLEQPTAFLASPGSRVLPTATPG